MTTDTALLILIRADGSRITTEIKRDMTSRCRAFDRPLREFAQRSILPADRFAGSVLIIGTEVQQYSANETREILGLE